MHCANSFCTPKTHGEKTPTTRGTGKRVIELTSWVHSFIHVSSLADKFFEFPYVFTWFKQRQSTKINKYLMVIHQHHFLSGFILGIIPIPLKILVNPGYAKFRLLERHVPGFIYYIVDHSQRDWNQCQSTKNEWDSLGSTSLIPSFTPHFHLWPLSNPIFDTISGRIFLDLYLRS